MTIFFFTVPPNICLSLSMVLATSHPSGAWNFEADPKFLEDLCNPVLCVVVHSCVNYSRLDAHLRHSIIVFTVLASILL